MTTAARPSVEYRYRNRHNDRIVTMVDAPMMSDAMYCYAERWTGVDADGHDVPCPERYRIAFGLPGRDGTTFDPQHWVRIG